MVQLRTPTLQATAGIADPKYIAHKIGGNVTPVHLYSVNEFCIKHTLVHMEFVRDASGAVFKVVLYQHGEVKENLRVTA